MMTIDNHIKDNKITCNIYGTNGELLVGVGTPINNNILRHLDNRKWTCELPNDCIYDNIALLDDDLETLVIPENINAKEITRRAIKIVELILNNPVIFSNLNRIKEFDEYTYTHCTHVAYLAAAMGLKMGIDRREIINLTIAALTHDIGKCCIDVDILNKPGKLTDEEYEIIKNHSMYGYSIICEYTDFDPIVAKSILHHHENYDGSGYPAKLKGNAIPIHSSILHVCDVFDALVSERPYKKKMNEYDSINVLKNNIGKMFDPFTVGLFCSSMQVYGLGSIIELPNGGKAKITEIITDDNNNVLGLNFEEIDMDISLDSGEVKLVKKISE